MISKLALYHYKNYASEVILFDPGLNFLIGRNGVGKTNLLDAVYYLCMARSHGTPLDRDSVQFGKSFFRIEANITRAEADHKVCVKVKPGEIKDILVDGKSVNRLSDYIGFIPVIMLAPEDVILIQGGSATRRRFLDVALCQADKEYLENIQRYNKLLAQRNALLRTDGYRADKSLLMTYSKSMAEVAKTIYQCRDALVKELIHDIHAYYQKLSGHQEEPDLKYVSHLADFDFEQLAIASLEADLQNARTTKGVHRDDVEILLDTYSVKRFGSQGQLKSLLIAMHLAQADYLARKTGSIPVLLLDDIFDRLDEERALRLIEILADHPRGQVLITDASPARVDRLLSLIEKDVRIIEIVNGKIGAHREQLDGPENGNLRSHDDSEE